MTSRDDATRAAVAPLLADLRGDLLVMPEAHVVEQHLEMMTFEAQVLATPRFTQQRPRHRMPHPRRAIIAFLSAFSTLVSCGLSAAGALPAPLQHITESIARTFGVPQSDHSAPASDGNTPGEAPTDKPAPAAVPAPDTTPKSNAPTPAADAHPTTPTVHKSTVSTTAPTTVPVQLPDAETPIAPNRPHVPSPRFPPDDPGSPPSNNSANTPPGFPSDWRDQAATAATAQLVLVCPQYTDVSPVNCPQQAAAPDLDPSSQTLTWTLLNQPYDGAVVIAKTTPGNPARHLAPTTAVTVYAAYKMVATYTATDGTTHYAYSGGIGAATMTWNGETFVNVSFGPGSVAGRLLPGVKPPSLPRAGSLDDNRVRSAVQSAFAACTATTTVAEGPTPRCPQVTAPGEQWTVTGDPTQGAKVAYDSTSGLFTVTGTYAMTSSLGNAAGGPYTATLFYDGNQLQVVGITPS